MALNHPALAARVHTYRSVVHTPELTNARVAIIQGVHVIVRLAVSGRYDCQSSPSGAPIEVQTAQHHTHTQMCAAQRQERPHSPLVAGVDDALHQQRRECGDGGDDQVQLCRRECGPMHGIHASSYRAPTAQRGHSRQQQLPALNGGRVALQQPDTRVPHRHLTSPRADEHRQRV